MWRLHHVLAGRERQTCQAQAKHAAMWMLTRRLLTSIFTFKPASNEANMARLRKFTGNVNDKFELGRLMLLLGIPV